MAEGGTQKKKKRKSRIGSNFSSSAESDGQDKLEHIKAIQNNDWKAEARKGCWQSKVCKVP